jgi:hypothetical protein
VNFSGKQTLTIHTSDIRYLEDSLQSEMIKEIKLNYQILIFTITLGDKVSLALPFQSTKLQS